MIYYRLLDPKRKGTVVRTEGRSQQEFIPGRGWIESGELMQYFWPDSETYDCLEEISESEALALTK